MSMVVWMTDGRLRLVGKLWASCSIRRGQLEARRPSYAYQHRSWTCAEATYSAIPGRGENSNEFMDIASCCDSVLLPSLLMNRQPEEGESWSSGAMPKSGKAAVVGMSSGLKTRWNPTVCSAFSSASPSLLLFRGRPIGFWIEKTHLIFSRLHRAHSGFSPEHFSFRVPESGQPGADCERVASKVRTALVACCVQADIGLH
jgi:hypothetical protein